MKRGGTAPDNLEHIQTCEAIRQGMKDTILAFSEKQVLEVIEKNKTLKHARQKQCIGKKNSSYPSWKKIALRFTTGTA